MNEHPVPVLVVDDERDIRDACERILSRAGCAVQKAPDGAAGLKLLDQQSFDILLLDLKMPGIKGMEVLAVVREKWPEIQVIVITGFATVETAIEAMKQGAYDFIPKPFTPDQLRITVGRAMERIRLREEARRLAEERRRTLADLHQEQSRTRTIIRALPFGVVVTRPDGTVALMNPAFRRLVGLAADSQPGDSIAGYVGDQGLCDLAMRISQGEENPDRDWAYEFCTPNQRDLLARGTRIMAGDGSCLGAVLVLADLTAYKMLDKLKDEFVAKVSHELRSPLSTILLQLTLFLDNDPGGEAEDTRMLRRAKERTASLIAFVKDLLDISRMESGSLGQAMQRIEPAEFLEQAVEAHRLQAEEKKQSLSLEAAEGLPAVMADPVGLESVFTNLINNAIKYTPEGGAVTVRAAAEGGWLKVEVVDTGFGIAPEKQGKVFDKFYRVKDANTRMITGTGLGLPIVKSVVDGLGGRIELESTPGEGSTFSVWLPAG